MDAGYFDGACEPRNPGGAMGWGWIIGPDNSADSDGGSGTLVMRHEGEGFLAAAHENTNNIAEYHALIGLLTFYISANGQGPLRVLGDSMLVVNQVNGTWRCNSPRLQRLRDDARELIRLIPGGVTLQHIPRSQNSDADALSIAALEKQGIRRMVR